MSRRHLSALYILIKVFHEDTAQTIAKKQLLLKPLEAIARLRLAVRHPSSDLVTPALNNFSHFSDFLVILEYMLYILLSNQLSRLN